MFITIFSDTIKFNYKSKNWQYNFDEIKELGLLRKKKKYFFETIAFIAVTVAAYCCMIFTDMMDLYCIMSTALCYACIIVRFYNASEFIYYVYVKDIYQKETTIKIESNDRFLIGRQIDQYLYSQFERNIKNTA